MEFRTHIEALSTGFKSIDTMILFLVSLISVLVTTLVFTECRYWLQSRGNAGRFQGREPLTLPYAVPWLGGAFRMVNPHALYFYALKKSPQQRPVRLRAGPIGIYLLFGAKNIKAIFKNSKILSKVSSTTMIFHNSGMSRNDEITLENDKSGIGVVSLMDIPEKRRVFKRAHDVGYAHLLNAPSVTVLTDKFVEEFIKQLDEEPLSRQNTAALFSFLKTAMFKASCISLIGPEIFRLNPDFAKTYWDYDDAFLLIAIGMPFYWKGRRARDRMSNAVKKWVRSAWKNFDEKDSNSTWEKHFGSRFSRNMMLALDDGGVSHDGQAVAMMPMIWAINSNAIPCAAWVMLETLQRPGLFQRLHEEVSMSVITDSTGRLSIDVPKLIVQSPLLTSIYLECLRIRTSVTVTRKLMDDLECDGYILKKGSHIMSPSWLPNHSELWDVPGHPATEFWPERFIEMPKMKSSNPDEKSQYEMAMRPENFFPYGGGNLICTGRFFAKQEILAAVALLVLKFEMEPQGWITADGKTSDRAAKLSTGYDGAGVIPPDRDMLVQITRIK